MRKYLFEILWKQYLHEATFAKGKHGLEVIVDDWEIADNPIKYLGRSSDDVVNDWLSLFSDHNLFPQGPILGDTADEKYIETANNFLRQINAPIRCTEKISQNEEGEITWRMVILQ